MLDYLTVLSYDDFGEFNSVKERGMIAYQEEVGLNQQAQARVQTLLDELTGSNLETGLQVAAYLDGKLIVDAWSGLANRETGQRVDGDTLFLAFSCTKGVTATIIHQLAEQGKLDYDAPIADYWPEFAANGKAEVTIRQAMTHTAGIPQTPKGADSVLMCDWGWMSRQVSQLKPLWKPGTKTGYHGLTYGVILGNVAERIEQRPFREIWQTAVAEPLGLDDFYLGVPDGFDESCIAVIEGGRVPWWFLPPFMLIKRAVPSWFEPGPLWNQSIVRHAMMPAGNMITTAKSLAKHYAALMGDGVDGVRLLPESRVKIGSALQTNAPDQVFFGSRIRKGLGYWLGGDADNAFGLRTEVFGHTGAGGLIGFADPTYNLAIAVFKNRCTYRMGDDSDCKIAHVIREALRIPD